MDNFFRLITEPDQTLYNMNADRLRQFMGEDTLFSDLPVHYDDYGLYKRDDKLKIARSIRYTTNSQGFRSPELRDTDLLFAGCSYTFGVGIQQEAIWGNIVAEKLGTEAINLSSPGAGIDRIIGFILSYLKTYHAKTIMCLFPDFGRMLYPVSRELVSYKTGECITNDSFEMNTIFLTHNMNMFDRPKFAKKPYFIEDTVPFELSFFNSIKNIIFLQQYCDARDITLYWGTWDVVANDALNFYNKENNLYKNLIDTNKIDWIMNKFGKEKPLFKKIDNIDYDSIEDICHLDLKEKFSDTFYSGVDIEDITDWSKERPHPGVHRHAHFAESFLDAII